MMKLGVRLEGVARERVRELQAAMIQGLERGVLHALLHVQRIVQMRKLSGEGLNVRTGTLRRSFGEAPRVSRQGSTVRGSFGSILDYAILWEFGGIRPAQEIRPVRRKALRFEIEGQVIFARVVRQPAREQEARPYVRPTMQEERETIGQMLMGEVRGAATRFGVRMAGA